MRRTTRFEGGRCFLWGRVEWMFVSLPLVESVFSALFCSF